MIDFEFAHQGWLTRDVASLLLRIELFQPTCLGAEAPALPVADWRAFTAGYGLDPVGLPEFQAVLMFELMKMLLNAPMADTALNAARINGLSDMVGRVRTASTEPFAFSNPV